MILYDMYLVMYKIWHHLIFGKFYTSPLVCIVRQARFKGPGTCIVNICLGAADRPKTSTSGPLSLVTLNSRPQAKTSQITIMPLLYKNCAFCIMKHEKRMMMTSIWEIDLVIDKNPISCTDCNSELELATVDYGAALNWTNKSHILIHHIKKLMIPWSKRNWGGYPSIDLISPVRLLGQRDGWLWRKYQYIW